MIKYILFFVISLKTIFCAELIPNNINKILDLEEKTSINTINHYKMSYKEFIQYRWENNIEHSESWGTEIMYELYLLDNTRNIEKINKLLEFSSKRLTFKNMEEIENEILIKYTENLISSNELEILNSTIDKTKRVMISNPFAGGEGGSSGDGDGGDGDGDGGDGD